MQKEYDTITALIAKHGPVWKGRDGMYVPIKLMEQRHLLNTYKMLMRRKATAQQSLDLLYHPVLGLHGEMSQDCIPHIEEEGYEFINNCANWLRCLGEEIDRRNIPRPEEPQLDPIPNFVLVDVLPNGQIWRIETEE